MEHSTDPEVQRLLKRRKCNRQMAVFSGCFCLASLLVASALWLIEEGAGRAEERILGGPLPQLSTGWFSWLKFVGALRAVDLEAAVTVSVACPAEGVFVLVLESERRAFVCLDGLDVGSVPVAFGSNGLGKQMPGDLKTPVGRFGLDTPRPSVSGYHVFIPMRIPRKMGSDVGIHGPHEEGQETELGYDWTAGCIATGAVKDILWLARMVRDHNIGTIIIRPRPAS